MALPSKIFPRRGHTPRLLYPTRPEFEFSIFTVSGRRCNLSAITLRRASDKNDLPLSVDTPNFFMPGTAANQPRQLFCERDFEFALQFAVKRNCGNIDARRHAGALPAPEVENVTVKCGF
jgi:hypothetical protein